MLRKCKRYTIHIVKGTLMTHQKPQATCDKCHREFDIVVKEKPVKGGGAKLFFKCPHCRKQYLIANITAEGVKIREQIKTATGDELVRLREEYSQHVTGDK